MCIPGIAVRTDAFDEVGGMDERFQGWGPEDAALRVKLATLFGDPPAPEFQHRRVVVRTPGPGEQGREREAVRGRVPRWVGAVIVAAILYAYPPTRHAGADIYNAHQLEALAAAGHEVRVFTTQKSPAYTRNGVIVHGNARDYPRVVDIVWTAPDAGPMGRILAQRKGRETGPGGPQRAPRAPPPHCNAGYDFIVWNAEATRVPAPTRCGSLVVRPPVYVPDNPRTGDAVTLINLSADKGAEVWWRLAERNPDTPFLGVLSWGAQMLAHPEGKYCPNVQLLPTVPHARMGDVWARTGVLLAPSKTEAWGMAAVEALAHGIPVIAHPTPGLTGVAGHRRHVHRPGRHRRMGLHASEPRIRAHQQPVRQCRARARELATLTANDTRALVAALEGLA